MLVSNCSAIFRFPVIDTYHLKKNNLKHLINNKGHCQKKKANVDSQEKGWKLRTSYLEINHLGTGRG